MSAYDLVVIGAGPGGYTAAIRAAQLGLKTAIIEKERALGGTCLRIGCIPSKALLEASEKYYEARNHLKDFGIKATVELDLPAMLERQGRIVTTLTKGIEGLMKKNKITRYAGSGRIAGAGTVAVDGDAPQTLQAKHILIATGSVSTPLPGVEIDGDLVGTSTEALTYPEVPKHLAVIGAGVIGMELGSVWLRLGAKVTVLEYLDRVLPGMDEDLSKEALKIFTKQGFDFHLSTRVTAARAEGKGCIVEIEGSEPIRCSRVLVAVGRKPYTEGIGLERVGIKTDKAGRIGVDGAFQTNAAGVYAIGDVIRGPMLAHKAEEEGIACIERIATGYGHVNYDAIPDVVYTQPEVASVGKTEQALRDAEVPYKKGMFPFMANGRARVLGDISGFVKVLAHAETDRVLGVHILGNRAGDLIAEAAAAIEFGASSEDIARTCHAHPTLSEALKEAALAVDGRTRNL